MGSSSSMQDPELRTLVHKVNAFLNSKSTILYQISLLKLKLNSRSSYEHDSDARGIQNEIEALPTLISTLQQFSDEKASNKIESTSVPTDVEDILQAKDNELLELESKYLDLEQVIDKLLSKRDSLAQKLKLQIESRGPEKLTLVEVKEKCSEIVNESKNIESLIAELKEKLEFLNKKKAEIMIKRGNKRKSYLGMSILNKSAMDLRSKFILKQELIKTIQQTKAEQDMQMANFESRNKMINIRNENLEDEELALSNEVNMNKDKIIELEWEIQKLNKERNGMKKDGAGSKESVNFEYGNRFGSGESDPGSLGSSLASLLNEFGDYRLEKEAMAEENLKLKEHIQGIISVKRNK